MAKGQELQERVTEVKSIKYCKGLVCPRFTQKKTLESEFGGRMGITKSREERTVMMNQNEYNDICIKISIKYIIVNANQKNNKINKMEKQARLNKT